MPRTADHEARRTQICGGVRKAARTQGLGAVTIAAAAQAAGVSVGLVQHYYESKDALLIDTLERVLADILSRVGRATAAAEADHARIEHMLGAGIEQLLPLDEVRREEAYFRMAFAGLALDHEAFRPHQRRFAETLQQQAARAIGNAFECGEIPDSSGIDPDLKARALAALVDGLCGRLLTDDEPDGEARAKEVVATRMSALFAGPCSHQTRIPRE